MSDSLQPLWTVARQAPLPMRFSKQEYWSGLPFFFQGIFPTRGTNPHLLCVLHWQARSLPLVLHGKPTISWSLFKLMSTESEMPPNHLILYHPLLLLPSIFTSIKVLSNQSALHIRWPKYWSFSFSISPSNEYSGLISFRIDWFGLLAVQGTQESSPTP